MPSWTLGAWLWSKKNKKKTSPVSCRHVPEPCWDLNDWACESKNATEAHCHGNYYQKRKRKKHSYLFSLLAERACFSCSVGSRANCEYNDAVVHVRNEGCVYVSVGGCYSVHWGEGRNSTWVAGEATKDGLWNSFQWSRALRLCWVWFSMLWYRTVLKHHFDHLGI